MTLLEKQTSSATIRLKRDAVIQGYYLECLVNGRIYRHTYTWTAKAALAAYRKLN